MLTECPRCHTVFRVTGAILKMGHGQVRCGKCRTQFDALESLIDEEETAATPEPAPTSPPKEEPTIEASEPDVAEEITMEGSRIEISGTYRVHGQDRAGEPESEQVFHEHVVIDRDEPHLESANEDDDAPLAPSDDDEIILAADDGEPVAEAAAHLLPQDRIAAAEEEPAPMAQRIWRRMRGRTQSHYDRQIAAELDALTYSQAPRAEKRGLWIAVTVLLAIGLIAQIVHRHRDALVRSPQWGPTVTRAYHALGLTLTPNWELNSYELQQWGVVSDNNARDALRVRASVTNTAAFAQPYPHVKLALQDRWGATVAVRAFAPQEYLQSAADRMMASRQRANAEIVIVDPGADAVGFQIFACLPQAGGILCSDDLPARQ